MERNYNNIGIKAPEALLPDKKVNMRKWSVIACDQYTANEGYWNEVERAVGGSPSSLHIMLPEIYLESADREDRIANTKQIMTRYIDDGILTLLPEGFILVERTVNRKTRKGLMVLVDLEEYDADPFRRAQVRASEEVLEDRVEARMDIRVGAELEMPHILLLMDDVQQKVIEPVWRKRDSFTKLYDVDLMMHGGRATGYLIEDKSVEEEILYQLSQLKTRDGMRFCIGDGNHSFATAKAVWEEAKRDLSMEEQERHPLRYAMCELVNLHDSAMPLLPIHRVISGVSSAMCIQYVVDHLNSVGADARLVFSRRKPELQLVESPEVIFFTSKTSAGRIEISSPTTKMLVEQLQPVLEDFVREHPLAKLEYIHGDAEFERVTQQYDTLGFVMPAMDKNTFFDELSEMGVFPKKCFSLGEANEKRYYIECRLLTEHEEEPEEEVEELLIEADEEDYEVEYDAFDEDVEELYEEEEAPAPQKLKEFRIGSLFRKKND